MTIETVLIEAAVKSWSEEKALPWMHSAFTCRAEISLSITKTTKKGSEEMENKPQLVWACKAASGTAQGMWFSASSVTSSSSPCSELALGVWVMLMEFLGWRSGTV